MLEFGSLLRNSKWRSWCVSCNFAADEIVPLIAPISPLRFPSSFPLCSPSHLSPEKDDQLSAQSESTDNPPNPATNEQTENESNQDSQTKSPNEESDQKDGTSQKKRKNDFKDANRSKKKSKDDVEIRFLISNKQAGLLIGKKGANITFLRQHFNSSVIITDCAGPERY